MTTPRTVGEPAAKPWVDLVRTALGDIGGPVDRWSVLARPEREVEARPVADALYHTLAASLLLAEGQILYQQREDCRKFLVAALYIRRWLRPPAPPAPLFPPPALAWLEALVDWTPVPAEALSAV